jgi:hypothetical protein
MSEEQNSWIEYERRKIDLPQDLTPDERDQALRRIAAVVA